jgi:cystathionine beta-lyase
MVASLAFQDWLVEKSGVQLNSGRGYGKGGDRCMRMNVGCSRQVLNDALSRIKEAVRTV